MKTISMTQEEFELVQYALTQLKPQLIKAVEVYTEDKDDVEQMQRAKDFASDLVLCNKLIQNEFADN